MLAVCVSQRWRQKDDGKKKNRLTNHQCLFVTVATALIGVAFVSLALHLDWEPHEFRLVFGAGPKRPRAKNQTKATRMKDIFITSKG